MLCFETQQSAVTELLHDSCIQQEEGKGVEGGGLRGDLGGGIQPSQLLLLHRQKGDGDTLHIQTGEQSPYIQPHHLHLHTSPQ